MMTKVKKSFAVFSGKRLKKVVAVLTCLLILLTSLMTVFAMIGSGVNSNMTVGAASGQVIYYKWTGAGTPNAYIWGGNDGTPTLWPGDKMTLAEEETNVYKYVLPGDQVNVVFNVDGNNKTDDLTIQPNSVYYQNEWKPYDGPATHTGEIYHAELSTEINQQIEAGNLYAVNATFYDYYTDYEYENGWRETQWYDSHGAWEPYQTFNGYIARYAKDNDSWTYPLYVGNYFDKTPGRFPDGYFGSVGISRDNQYPTQMSSTEANALYKFNYLPNNSNGLENYSISVQGLVDQKLNSENALTVGNGVEMPYFNDEFIIKNGIGTVVETKMPMRVTQTTAGNDLYIFSSQDGKDNIWFSGYDNAEKELTMNYGEGNTYAMYDALAYYSNGEASGLGFFPFDSKNDTSSKDGSQKAEAEDFGFGMRVDAQFTLPKGGAIDSENVQFTYTGDDDVWVYVDGVLVLDLGGDHKKASGSIDFATKQSSITTGTYDMTTGITSGVGTTQYFDFPSLFGDGTEAFDNNDTEAVHELTVFYMERGMSESNLEFSFNFQEIGNELEVEKQVDYSGVNTGLVAQAEKVYGAHEFDGTVTYGESEASATNLATQKEYTKYDSSTSSSSVLNTGTDGKFSIADKDKLSFVNQYTPGDYVKIVESNADAYDTSWVAKDMTSGVNIASSAEGSDDKEAIFKYEKISGEFFDKTHVGVVFTNKIKTGAFNLSKEVLNPDSTPATDTSPFEFTVEVKLPGETDFGVYPLTGVLTDTDGSTSNAALDSNGKISITDGQSIEFTGLPIGAEVLVTESVTSGYTWDEQIKSATISTTVVDIDYVNTISNASTVLEAYKYLNGELSTTQYDFELLDDEGNVIAEAKNSAVDGKIQFTSALTDKLTFDVDDVGNNVFYIREKIPAVPDSNTVYGTEIYKAIVNVSTDAYGAIVTTMPVYFVLTSGEMLGNANEYTIVQEYPEVKFNNKNIGTLTVNKVDENNEPLTGAKFKLVPATLDPMTSEWTYTDEDFNTATELEIVNPDGQIIFTNLELGTYFLVETKAPESHQLLAEAVEITIDTTDLNQVINVEDPGKPDLPVTGADITPYIMYIVAGGFILVAGALFFIFRKRIGKTN